MENQNEKLGEFLGRLLRVLVSMGMISARDALFIMGEMDESEWLGDDDE